MTVGSVVWGRNTRGGIQMEKGGMSYGLGNLGHVS